MNELVPRRLQYSATHSPGSWAIRRVSAGPFSHVDTVLPPGYRVEGVDRGGWFLGARSDVLMGVPAGFEARPPNYEKWSATATIELSMTAAEAAAFDAFELAQLHKPYDSIGILGFIAPDFVAVKREDWRKDDNWFCSEEKQAAGETAGFLPEIYFPLNRVYPVANYQMFMATGRAKLVSSYNL